MNRFVPDWTSNVKGSVADIAFGGYISSSQAYLHRVLIWIFLFLFFTFFILYFLFRFLFLNDLLFFSRMLVLLNFTGLLILYKCLMNFSTHRLEIKRLTINTLMYVWIFEEWFVTHCWAVLYSDEKSDVEIYCQRNKGFNVFSMSVRHFIYHF